MSTEPTPPINTSSTPVPMTPSPQPTNSSIGGGGNWKLPVGIEDHIEDGVTKITIGVVIGGTLGMLLFKSGRGWRSACIASGLGVALGSTYVRFLSSTPSSNRSNGTNNTNSSSNTATASTANTP
jgi:Domain of unknown function (DUF543)